MKYFPFLFLILACHSSTDKNYSVFRYNITTQVSSLDPAFARTQANIWATQPIFNTLIELDDSLHLKPGLASSWQISPDGLTYTFHIHSNIYFHDCPAFANGVGEKLKSSDIAFSFNRLIDSTLASPGSWIFRGRIRENNPFDAVNDSTFLLHLNKPFQPLLSLLTMPYTSIVSEKAVKFYGPNFRSNPIGTGPFFMYKWIEDQGLFLRKFKNYWKSDTVNLDGLRMTFIPDRKMAYLELLRNKIDFFSGLEASIASQLLTPSGDLNPEQKNINLLKTPYLNMEYLGINLKLCEKNNSPLALKKIRQAMNYAINKEQMLQTMRNNIGKPATAGFIPRGLPAFDDKIVKGYSYNPDKARELLKECGFENGKNLPELHLAVQNDYADLCTFLAHQWEEIGIKVKVDVMESAVLREGMSKGTIPFFRASWIADYPDPESFMTVFYSHNPSPPNYTNYKNESFDKLYETVLTEQSDSKRNEMYHKMDQHIVDDAPVIFLFYDEAARFVSKRVKGIYPNAMNNLSFERLYLVR